MPMKKVCPRCGATFDCMHNDILSCHCATVRLDALQRTYLMENYSGQRIFLVGKLSFKRIA